MENPNAYNDEAWGKASSALESAVGSMWEAGASLDEIESAVCNALENCEVPAPFVSIVAGG